MARRVNQLAVGITGPRGFIAGHLARRLAANPLVRIIPCSRAAFGDSAALRAFTGECDVVLHLAGMNRGQQRDVYDTNIALADRLIEALAAFEHPPHVIFASSTQRDQPGEYGRSKRDCEERFRNWAGRSGGRLTTLIIPNVFGPGCRPFYNSVVATFCHQLAHGQQPLVIDDQQIEFVWINDLIETMCQVVRQSAHGLTERRVAGTARLAVSEMLAKLSVFRRSYFDENVVPDLSDPLDASLYTTFLSYIDLDDHCHRPRVHRDDRGQLFEILRMASGGQIFFSTTKPGVIRGNHFHTRKIEWFCVLRGEAAIRIRRVGDDQIREFRVSGESPQFISIPALHTHQIENIGTDELLTMFWCNEIFQPADPDTFVENVA
ncbi:MAG: NAD-dependent epimerase/dehydratase family protein [Pirellulales bacterium]